MEKTKLIEDELKKYNQEHILKYIETLNEEKRKEILDQIEQINFEQIFKLYENTKLKQDDVQSDISPISYIDKSKMSDDLSKKVQKKGEEIIKKDQYAVVTMAGGQGTRLGCNGPKGTYKLDIGEKGKYIFEILTEALKKSKDLYNILPYWYIMTSTGNNEQTIDFFEKHNYFGYDKKRVKFFKQSNLPVLTKDRKIDYRG